MRRMVKLPLRKHHSFHFQPSQTVAGALKQTKNRYKNNGPLVFKPFNEKSAFKPITPLPKSPIETLDTQTTLSSDTEVLNGDHPSDNNTNDGSEHVYNITTSLSAAPRICGTSLKRHISNVETYNRTRTTDETNSMSDDEDSVSVTPPSSSSASVARGKRLHYADLAPLCASSTSTSTSNTNLNLINCTTSSSRNSNLTNNNNNNSKNTSKNNSNNHHHHMHNNNNNNNNGAIMVAPVTLVVAQSAHAIIKLQRMPIQMDSIKLIVYRNRPMVLYQ